MKMFSLYKTVRKQPLMKKFMRQRLRKNKGVMWLSLVSIGFSALLMGVRRGQKYNTLRTITKKFTQKNSAPIFNNAVATEFSEELLSSALGNSNRGNQGRS